MTEIASSVQQAAVQRVVSSVVAADGYRLTVHRYAAPDPHTQVVLAGGTGIPQGFYRRFAEHAAARGFDVATLDYRGIGESAPATLRGFSMDYRDWGRLDVAAVVADMAADGGDVHLVGHSYGGMTLGLLPDPSQVASMVAIGTGSGWHGHMPLMERIRVRVSWDVVAPVLTATTGYLAMSRVGMGEDLPLDAYRQWKNWCRYRGFFFDDPEEGAQMRALYARVDAPIVAMNSTDDRWIPPASRDSFMPHYSSAAVTTVDLTPAAIGVDALGHMGYFRRGSERLWDDVLDRIRPGLTPGAPPSRG